MRYGVQVNSPRADRGPAGEQRPADRPRGARGDPGRNARARAIQLPAWNEALGLPRPWDQQWSLRIQQVLAFETDLLEYPDIFEGSKVMDGLVAELVEGAEEEMKIVADQGGAVEAVAYMKARLVESHRERIAQDRARARSRSSARTASPRPRTRRSPPAPTAASSPRTPRSSASAARRSSAGRPSATRPRSSEALARARRRRRATSRANIMPATIAAAKAGATTGEWARHAARGVRRLPRPDRGLGRRGRRRRGPARRDPRARRRARRADRPPAADPGRQARPRRPLQRRRADRRPRPRRRHGGRSTRASGSRPSRSPPRRVDEDVDVVGLSILSGSHLELIPETVRLLREQGSTCPVVVGGIIPAADAATLREAGRRRASTRRRTSTSTGSWARSSISSLSAAPPATRSRSRTSPQRALRTPPGTGSHRSPG